MDADWRDFELDEMPYWHAKAQTVLFAAVGVSLFAAGFFLLVKPLQAEIEDSKHQESILSRQFKAKANQVASLPNVDEQVALLQRFYINLSHQLPEESELSLLVAGINDIGVQNKLDFNRLAWQPSQPIGWLHQVPLEIELSGNYRNIGRFSADLAKLPRIVAMQDFSLERVAADKDRLKLRVTAYTYRYTDKTQESS